MDSRRFVGREKELERLRGLNKKRSSSLIVVRGRRRIGKSCLLMEFGKEMESLLFSGIPPGPRTTAQSEREEFALQMGRFGVPGIKADDWGNLFWHLSKQTEKGQILIVFDEISWMGGKDPEFLGKLKNAWDMYFSQNPNLILVLCGSVSSWIEDNILSNTGFLGRITLDLTIEELSLKESCAFWGAKASQISAYEKLKVLSVTGGVPLYLEQIRPDLSAEDNIHNLCFSQGGLLVREFDEIFSDLFSKRNERYKRIVQSLANGPKDLAAICKEIGKSQGGTDSKHLDDLVKAGFLKRDFTWSMKTGKESKLSRYRLSDNYLRFYLKYIAPKKQQILQGKLENGAFFKSANWESIMGLQFENLVVHNRKSVIQQLNLSPENIVMDGPFFQNPTKKQSGCQIDYMLQTRFQTLYLCEVKFCKNPVGKKVILEMKEKTQNLKKPKYCSVRPVLIHVNGVEDSVLETEFFDTIIDFSSLT